MELYLYSNIHMHAKRAIEMLDFSAGLNINLKTAHTYKYIDLLINPQSANTVNMYMHI